MNVLHRLAFKLSIGLLLVFVLSLLGVFAHSVKIPEATFRLSNGLTVVISEDRSTPNVAVELWLRAGSRYEERGHWGEAHFCEHMLGATRLPTIPGRVLDGNAQTRRDFTRYYLLVPREALEYAVAQQADRLDFPLAAMNAKRLADNRDIVISEFRGNESRPFGYGSPSDVKLLVNGFGPEHPYGRPLQLNSDILTITDEDMRRWVAAHTLPSDAILFLAGNVSATEARPLVERYFNPIAALRPESPSPRSRTVVEPIQPTPERRERMEVNTPAGRLLAVWATPAYGSPEADYLSLFVEVLAAPEVGRLYHRLVSVDKLATTTAADVQPEELAGAIRATVVLKPEADPQRAESAFLDEVNKLVLEGPTIAELRTAKARILTRLARRAEQLGWQSSRIDILGEGMLFRGDAEAYRQQLDRISNASREDIIRAAQTWVRDHGYLLTAVPQSNIAAKGTIDRSKPIVLAEPVPPSFPAVKALKLTNGLSVGLVERGVSPLVNITVVIPTLGDAKQGTTETLVLALTDRDPSNHSPRAMLWRQCVFAGCDINVTADQTATIVSIESLAANRDLSLRAAASLFAPETPDTQAWQRAVSSMQTRRASQDANARATEILNVALAGGDPRNAQQSIDSDSLKPASLPPSHATLLVAGSLPASSELTIKQLFASPSRARTTDLSQNPASAATVHPVVYFLDVPGQTQTSIVAGERLPQIKEAMLMRTQLAVGIAGNRVNANLRTQHQWAYGAQARLASASDGSPIILISSEVQNDHTADAIAEIRHELDQREPTSADLARLPFYRRDLIQPLAGSAATVDRLNTSLAQLARRGISLTAYPALLQKASAVDADSLRDALRLLNGQALVFVLVGDFTKMRLQLDAAGITPIQISPSR